MKPCDLSGLETLPTAAHCAGDAHYIVQLASGRRIDLYHLCTEHARAVLPELAADGIVMIRRLKP